MPSFLVNFFATAAPDADLELVDIRYQKSRVIGAQVQEQRGRPREHERIVEYQFADYWKAHGVNQR